jgi:hypothetical protein
MSRKPVLRPVDNQRLTFCVVKNDKIISSFEIYHPKNVNHNHNDNKAWITIFF